jgi:hypothetical protein
MEHGVEFKRGIENMPSRTGAVNYALGLSLIILGLAPLALVRSRAWFYKDVRLASFIWELPQASSLTFRCGHCM